MVLVKNSLIAKLLRVEGIVIYPFVLFADKDPAIFLLNHEMIHVQQIKKNGYLNDNWMA